MLHFKSEADYQAFLIQVKRTYKPASTPKPPKMDHVPGPAEVLAIQLRETNIDFVTEFAFHPRRRWRADFCLGGWLLVECEGGAWKNGRHNRAKGFEEDIEKYSAALMLGFVVLRVTPRQIMNGKALVWVQKLLALRAGNASTHSTTV